ncbi:MAG: hypothetical protein OEZ38_13945, partial [Gammaproteobacteria bacterium]|nr:hypothetical protein [Gammaproteobacteria bacterium]
VCLLTAVIIFKLEYMSQLFGQQLHMSVVIMLGTVSFIMLLLSFYRSYYHLIFMSYAGGVSLLSLSYKPWDKKCKKFVEVLQKNINYAHNRSGVTRQIRIVDEMKDLRRLEKIGIISNKDYNRAQKKILAAK